GLRRPTPDFAVSTDIIVGFPSETDDDFQRTVALVEEVRFSFIFAFKYSSRPRTPAARFPAQVPEEVKSKRLNYLLALQKKITTEQNNAEIGNERQVLVYYQSKKEPHIYYGRTDHFRLVRIFSRTNIVGKMLTVKITAGNATALVGCL
ncbi:MAG: tRNA (N6-isopentenyl adenosine(37)-C2)-methylthiotransferase MiaB, partial [Pseudomonadota bacterium]|nr:tRNA (N6-isopentenyl adenosine(37)-C2)-methylthiotransferase MiaB [Pseudomonadota bacterium]